MARTRWRPLPRGELTSLQTVVFAGVIGGIGMFLLYRYVNALTMWLTFGTFVGYAVVYTILLKPATPQNIVIGGLSGAMPPLLGWTAVTGEVAPEALLLVLIIYAWTPPHFWALALYRTEDFNRAGLPMLPVTHGQKFTRLHVLLYTLMLIASTLLPFVYGMSGWIYLARGARSGRHVPVLRRSGSTRAYSDRLAQQTFRYSIVYLAGCSLRCCWTTMSRRLFQRWADRAAPHARCACVLALTLGGCRCGRQPEFKNTDITGTDCCRDFHLTDHTAERARWRIFAARWW